jgi:hypothetical protein
MALLGRRNWWSPSFLRRLHERLGLGETVAGGPSPADHSESSPRHPRPVTVNQGGQ